MLNICRKNNRSHDVNLPYKWVSALPTSPLMKPALVSAELPRLSISLSNEDSSRKTYVGSSQQIIAVVLFVEQQGPREPNIEDLDPITPVLCLVARRNGETGKTFAKHVIIMEA